MKVSRPPMALASASEMMGNLHFDGSMRPTLKTFLGSGGAGSLAGRAADSKVDVRVRLRRSSFARTNDGSAQGQKGCLVSSVSPVWHSAPYEKICLKNFCISAQDFSSASLL